MSVLGSSKALAASAGAAALLLTVTACPTNVAVPVASSSGSTSAAVTPPAPPTWAHGAISAGDDHTCAVVGGRVACWGHNEQGQMGDGTRSLRSAPQWVPGLDKVKAVAAGGYHTCALLEDGNVKCWGGETTSARRTTPIVAVRNVSAAVEIVSSTWMSCAKTGDGRVSCWGFDGEAREVTTTAKVVSMSAGYEHICLVEDDGVVECSIVKPVGRSADLEPVSGVTTRFDAKARVVMSSMTVCVLPSGAAPIACTTLPSNPHDEVKPFKPIAAIRGATDVVAGATEICAAVGERDALCFNSTDVGRLAEDSADDDSFKPRSAPHLRGYTSVAIGGLHRCGVGGGGKVDCWGLDQGQLGLHSKRQSQLVPRAVPNLNDVAELQAGLRRTCARKNDGTVACWGIDPASPRTESQPVDQPREIDGVTQSAQLQGGDEFICSLRANGAVTCWGSLTWRDCIWQAADKCQPERLFTPRSFPTLLDIPDATEITDRCALKKDGSVECIRFSQAHRIGTDKIETSGDPMKGIKAIAGQCALDGSGRVLCWGPNDHGQLGDGSKTDRAGAALVKGLSGVREIDAGDAHVCALLSDGSVQCWGDNSSGQIGDGTHDHRSTPVAVPGLAKAKHLALGDAFSCAQLEDGTARCWGSNENGALGDGSGFDQSAPVPVKDLKGVAELVAGPTHACARLDNGTATCWGWSPVNASVVNVAPDQPIHVALPK